MPTGLLPGELAVNLADEKLFTADANGTTFELSGSGGVTPGPTPPDQPTQGQIWFDSSNGLLYYWDGTQWVELGTAGDSPVTSVNGNVGAVVLTYSDVGAASTAQGELADSAIQPGVVNPVYFANEADFPDPALPSVHGGVAHSHAANAMFYAHNAQWLQLANEADTVPLGSWSSIPALT